MNTFYKDYKGHFTDRRLMMYRVSRTGENIYAIDMGDSTLGHSQAIDEIVKTGEPVIVCDDLYHAAELFQVDEDEIGIIT